MTDATLIGIDLGKHCFFVHAQDARGTQIWRKKMTRKALHMPGHLSGRRSSDGSLRRRALAGAQGPVVWTSGSLDCAAVRQAVRQGQQD